MKRHVAATLLALTTLGVLDAHVDVIQQDGGYLLRAQEKNHDVAGWVADQVNAVQRSCSAVPRHASTNALGKQVTQIVKAFSPPQSHSAQLRSLQQHGDWLLAEVSFEQLNSAVVLLKIEGEQLTLQTNAIWSGTTEPWRPGPWIRHYLQARAPGLPAGLLRCYDPTLGLFRPEG